MVPLISLFLILTSQSLRALSKPLLQIAQLYNVHKAKFHQSPSSALLVSGFTKLAARF
jgi:hypothetical protein